MKKAWHPVLPGLAMGFMLVIIVSLFGCGSTKGTNVRRGTQWVDGHYQVVETPQGPKRVWVRGRWE